jgi:glutathione S-transferase
MVCATVLGLAEEIERLDSAAHPVVRDERIALFNPLAKVPALRTEDGLCLYDSRVICEYLNARAQGHLYPENAEARWKSLARQALGDGIIDAALLARYEFTARPPEKQWQGWADAQLKKSPPHWQRLNTRSAVFAINPTISALLPSAVRSVISTFALPNSTGVPATRLPPHGSPSLMRIRR